MGRTRTMADPVEVIRAFLQIEPDQIAEDVAAWVRHPDHLAATTLPDWWARAPAADPAEAADALHRAMAWAAAFASRGDVPRAVRVHRAATAAGGVAEEAVDAALFTGLLGALYGRSREVVDHEGDPDPIDAGERPGPPEHRDLERALDSMMGATRQAMLLLVLRRYGLGDLADLAEGKPGTFDRLVARGRKITYPWT